MVPYSELTWKYPFRQNHRNRLPPPLPGKPGKPEIIADGRWWMRYDGFSGTQCCKPRDRWSIRHNSFASRWKLFSSCKVMAYFDVRNVDLRLARICLSFIRAAVEIVYFQEFFLSIESYSILFFWVLGEIFQEVFALLNKILFSKSYFMLLESWAAFFLTFIAARVSLIINFFVECNENRKFGCQDWLCCIAGTDSSVCSIHIFFYFFFFEHCSRLKLECKTVRVFLSVIELFLRLSLLCSFDMGNVITISQHIKIFGKRCILFPNAVTGEKNYHDYACFSLFFSLRVNVWL